VKVRAIVIDDEELARKRLIKMLAKYEDEINIVAEAEDGIDAIEKIASYKPDVIFLDVQMPGLDGFAVVKKLQFKPFIIFVTAYSEFALKAFEENSIDYLLKPVEQAHLDRAIQKLKNVFELDQQPIYDRIETMLSKLSNKTLRRIKITVGDKIYIIDVDEVVYIEARDKYTFVHTADKEYVTDDTLSSFEEKLDPVQFIRIHRSHIVNIKFVKEITRWFAGKYKVHLNDKFKTELDVSRGYADRIQLL
jgi:two-component system LytT family response regulator